MLYCLTRDLYDDIMIMSEHIHSKYDETNCMFIPFLPEHVRICSTFSLQTYAAKKIYDSMLWQYSTFIVRNWISTLHPFEGLITDLDFKHRETDHGFWEYKFSHCTHDKVYFSKSYFSSEISVVGGVPYYNVDDGLLKKEYTITEIAKSNQKFKMDAVFPPNPNMFSGADVEYIIPYSLI